MQVFIQGAVAEATNDECMIDVDGDGFGDGAPPSQYDTGTDCDDTSATELLVVSVVVMTISMRDMMLMANILLILMV